MTLAECIGILVSVIALAVAMYALWDARKLQRQTAKQVVNTKEVLAQVHQETHDQVVETKEVLEKIQDKVTHIEDAVK